jgi:hypothetical protein
MGLARPVFAPRLDLPLVGIVLAGVALRQVGLGLPEFRDSAAYQQAMLIPQTTDAGCDIGNFYERMDAIRTWRWTLKDGGEALILAALTLGCMRMVSGVRRYRDIPSIHSPGARWPFFVLGSAVVIGFCIAQAHSFVLGLQRSEYPWCADSVGIPLAGMMLVTPLFLSVALLIGFAISRLFGQLPVRLNAWNASRPAWSWGWTIILGGPSLLTFLMTVAAPLDAKSFAVPAYLVGIYIILSARAAIVGEREP